MREEDRAEEFFRNGCNCAQAVFSAYAEEMGIDVEKARLLSCGLGGGVGRMREVCGAVSAAAMVLGARHGGDRNLAYPAIQEFCDRFKKETGSIVCRELLALAGEGSSRGVPDERTSAYYKKRPCVELVRLAASLIKK